MKDTMIQQLMTEPKKITFREVPVPKPGPDQVLVKIKKIGICGSDIHVFHGTHPYTSYPVTQGHEVSAQVEAVGEYVPDIKPGERVTIEPQVFCGRCYPCLHGKYNLCEKLKVMGFQTTGTASEYFAVDSSKVTKLPDGLTYSEGAMIEPLSVAVHAAKRFPDLKGANTVVLGCGPIGILLIQSLKALGAAHVLATDISDTRLALAKELGADWVVNTMKEDYAKAVLDAYGPDKADVVYECAGSDITMDQAIQNARKGSTIILVAVFGKMANVDLAKLNDSELDLNTSMMYRHEDYVDAIRLVDEGKIKLGPLQSAHFAFADYQKAYEYIDNNRETTMKVLIDVDPTEEYDMKLTYEGLKDRTVWAAAGIDLPDYDPEAVSLRTREHPVWVHLGIGNIFRFFLGGIADRLLRENLTDRGITCVETFDYEIVDRIYQPFDNLALAVTLYKDGSQKRRVLGSLSEALALRPGDKGARDRLTQIFTDSGLQMVSFTITEKGYALHGADGGWLAPALKDAQEGPEKAGTAMGLVTAMLAERWKAGKAPLALVSMDNVSQNGKKLRESVLELAGCWVEKGFLPADFLEWISDENRVSFPWSMIDKITPRPVESVAAALKAAGVEDMDILVTNRQTWIAPFVNAEEPQYLVVEDRFPNGRPPLEKAGVYMTDRVTVNKSERMKVTACLNPIHTAVCTFDRLLGYELFADGMSDPELNALACKVGYDEGLPVVESPGILDPKAFLDEVLTQRFPNAGLGDTSARIAVDISQMLAIRFGETIKATQAAYGSADRLVGIPLAIAGWIRYLLAVDDTGAPFELSPDPMLPQLKEQLSTLCWNDPESLTGQLQPILSNERLFGVDLYAIGLGDRIESMVRSMLSGPGAVRSTLQAHLSK